MVLNSLNFCLSIKFLIFVSIFNEIFAWYSNCGCRFFSFITLNISYHSLLACRVYAERSVVNHKGFPSYVTCCFSLAAFNSLYVCLISVSLINMCVDVFLLGFILYFLDLIDYFLSHVGNFSTIISSKLFQFLSIFLFPLGPL